MIKVQFLPIFLFPYLPNYHFSDFSVNTGHRIKSEISNGDPFPISFSIEMLAMKDMQGKFEMRIGLMKNSYKLFDFNIHFHFFLDSVS